MPAIAGPLVSQQWDRRIARVWSSMLDACDVDPSGVAVEVGPGFSTKIGLWLAERSFRGTLFLVEPNRCAREWSEGRYHDLLPLATIVPVDGTLADAPAVLPRQIDALLMNHVLDDLMLHASLPPVRREALFASMRPGAGCAGEVRSAWNALTGDAAAAASAGASVIEDVCAFCAGVQPLLVVISQYRSWFHAHHGLEHVDQVTAPLVARLAKRLSAATPGLDVRLRGTGAHRGRWLVGARRTLREQASSHRPHLPYARSDKRGIARHKALER
jgi:hypothetical protein